MNAKRTYKLLLQGRPDRTVERLVNPAQLRLPLVTRRFNFSRFHVADGQTVAAGQVLATDPIRHSVPLLAPQPGRIDLSRNGLIIISVIPDAKPDRPAEINFPQPDEPVHGLPQRQRLLQLGAWQFFQDAFTGALPDPFAQPAAVIVNTLNFEPFVARGDVQLFENIQQFIAGLEHLQSLLEYQPIYLVLPDISTAFAKQIRQRLEGLAWINLVQVPLRYPADHFGIIALKLGLKRLDPARTWGVRTSGVLAVNNVLSFAAPALTRIIALGGPAVKFPRHLELPVGYPIADLLDGQLRHPARIVSGGMLTGQTLGRCIDDEINIDAGIDSECQGLTALHEPTRRKPFGWIRPAFNRRSYSRTTLGSFRRPFPEDMNTSLQGELRACINCYYCAEVCPAGIFPFLIHKYLYRDNLEQVESAGIDHCIDCGMCSYVCPSKIELRQEMLDARRRIFEELHEGEAAE